MSRTRTPPLARTHTQFQYFNSLIMQSSPTIDIDTYLIPEQLPCDEFDSHVDVGGLTLGTQVRCLIYLLGDRLTRHPIEIRIHADYNTQLSRDYRKKPFRFFDEFKDNRVSDYLRLGYTETDGFRLSPTNVATPFVPISSQVLHQPVSSLPSYKASHIKAFGETVGYFIDAHHTQVEMHGDVAITLIDVEWKGPRNPLLKTELKISDFLPVSSCPRVMRQVYTTLADGIRDAPLECKTSCEHCHPAPHHTRPDNEQVEDETKEPNAKRSRVTPEQKESNTPSSHSGESVLAWQFDFESILASLESDTAWVVVLFEASYDQDGCAHFTRRWREVFTAYDYHLLKQLNPTFQVEFHVGDPPQQFFFNDIATEEEKIRFGNVLPDQKGSLVHDQLKAAHSKNYYLCCDSYVMGGFACVNCEKNCEFHQSRIALSQKLMSVLHQL